MCLVDEEPARQTVGERLKVESRRVESANTRAAGSDEALKLTPHSVLSLEQSLEFIGDDELVEVTPKSIRMRKMILNKEKRLKAQSRGE